MSNDVDPPELGLSDSQVRKTERIPYNTTPGFRRWLEAYAASRSIKLQAAMDYLLLEGLERSGIPNPAAQSSERDLEKS